MIEKIIDQGTADYIYTKFGQLCLPFTFAGKLIHNDPSTHGDGKDGDYKWRVEKRQGVRGDVKLKSEENTSIAEITDHLVLRQRDGQKVYFKCVACMEGDIDVPLEYEKAACGFFIKNKCSASSETFEKLKMIAGQS